MNIFANCPVLKNDKFVLRLIQSEDCDDLLKVYSDKNALPFFNSDGCNGDNFYYPTKERMTQAVDFWKEAYENGWLVRFFIIAKKLLDLKSTRHNSSYIQRARMRIFLLKKKVFNDH